MILKNVTYYDDNFEKKTSDIEIENGIIKNISSTNEDGKDMSGLVAIPGFIDVHIHGANGGDASDASTESLEHLSSYLAKNGVTSFCPTTMTLSKEELLNIVDTISNFNRRDNYSKVVGIHLEGPYISKPKKGAQNEKHIRPGSIEEFNEIYDKSNGLVKIITIAPEAFDSEKFINEVSKKCVVSIGHTAANECETKTAFMDGASHVTHLYNAMTPMNHREAGVVGAAFDTEDVFCEMICDGGHICPTVIRNTFKILGKNRICVISDSMRAAGLGPGKYELGGQDVFVDEDGEYATLEDKTTIAASITNVYEEFKKLVSYGIDIESALRSCTINPAKSIGLDNKIGSIAVGKSADIVFLNDNLDIKEVYINGILA